MKFEIRNRLTGAAQVTAEIDCAVDAPIGIKIGLAAKWAYKTRADLSGAYLSGAYLAGADLSGANLADANLARAYLARANLARANLADADLARANLSGAYLARAYLARANLADANLARANLADADLADADLAGADLADANLSGANLADANLARAYLARAYLADANLSGANLDANLAGLLEALKLADDEIPVVPNIDAAILAAVEAGGALDMNSWHGPSEHWCGTTHCRAGWAIHLAGAAGKALQDKVGPQMAGALIYRASRPGIPAPWFFDSTEGAMADIRKSAAEQGGV